MGYIKKERKRQVEKGQKKLKVKMKLEKFCFFNLGNLEKRGHERKCVKVAYSFVVIN